MRTNRTPDEWNKWCIARGRIDDELKEYYRAGTTGELPPQLLALLKKLDEELVKKHAPCHNSVSFRLGPLRTLARDLINELYAKPLLPPKSCTQLENPRWRNRRCAWRRPTVLFMNGGPI